MEKLETWPIGKPTPKHNMRENLPAERLLPLGRSMLERGQLRPLIVQPDTTLLIGHQQLAAGKLVGMETILVRVMDGELSDTERWLMQLEENIHRHDPSDPEILRTIEELLRLNPTWRGKDVAKHTNMDESMVTRFLAVSKRAAPEVRKAFDAETFKIGVAYELAQNPPEEQSDLLALRLSGANRRELTRARRGKTRRAKGTKQSKFRLPSGIVVTISGQELTLERAVEAVFELGKQGKKCAEDGLDLRTAQLVLGQRWQRLAQGKVES